jgi:3-dehydroquinate dehydratase-2
MSRVLILNGPNLNLLGTREPSVYGHHTLADAENLAKTHAKTLGWDIDFQQSNSEGAMVDMMQAAKASCVGVVLNAAAYTHTSVALRDVISAIELPVIEVHLSNIHAREPFRSVNHIAPVALGQIAGFGITGYKLALDALAAHLEANT